MKLYPKAKRFLGWAMALVSILLLGPVLLLLALLIKLDSPGPILFRQERIGKRRKHFVILKFRTMQIGAPKDTPTHMLQNPEVYITKIGKLLRRTSLDELPQILNILKGDMAFVGPRPALWNQLDLIAERELYGANDVTPGVTGWAQINGRDGLSIKTKAQLDGEYVKRMSLPFDLKILIQTILKVVKSEGVREGSGKLKAIRKSGDR